MDKSFYNVVLSQTFSYCRKYLITGDYYGKISVFNLFTLLHKDDAEVPDKTSTNEFHTNGSQSVNSLVSAESYLIVGTVGEISGYPWSATLKTRNCTPQFKIEVSASQANFDKTDINSMQLSADGALLFAGCGDNNVYVLDLNNGGALIRTLAYHTDYIHSIFLSGYDLVSGSEDGHVGLWDTRCKSKKHTIVPYKKDRISRPELGKWIGTVSLNDDWLVCGGGPRLSLWHLGSYNHSTIFPIEDEGVHVSQFVNDKILAGGRSKYFYQMQYNGDIVSEIETSPVSVFSAVYQEKPNRTLSISGSSNQIDICGSLNYKDFVLCV